MISAFAISTTSAAAAVASVPSTCALYFNFTKTQESEMWFGDLDATGVLHARGANLGPRFDPQGQIAIAADGKSFSFTCDDMTTKKEKFGCCSRSAVATVVMATGSMHLADVKRKFPVIAGLPAAACGCVLLRPVLIAMATVCSLPYARAFDPVVHAAVFMHNMLLPLPSTTLLGTGAAVSSRLQVSPLATRPRAVRRRRSWGGSKHLFRRPRLRLQLQPRPRVQSATTKVSPSSPSIRRLVTHRSSHRLPSTRAIRAAPRSWSQARWRPLRRTSSSLAFRTPTNRVSKEYASFPAPRILRVARRTSR